MKRIERLALPQRLSGIYGHLFFAALNNMLKWNHRTNALDKHRFRPKADLRLVATCGSAACLKLTLTIERGIWGS
jgi:hypothetical protein